MFNRIVEPIDLALRDPAPPLPTGKIDAESVPEAARKQPLPLIRILMPIIMIAAMVGMVALIVLGGGGGRQVNPMMLMFPIMMLASVFMMFNPQSAGQDPDETRRTYLRHLRAVRQKAVTNGAAQRAHETHRHPDPEHLLTVARTRRLWERGASDPDALEVRLGLGSVSLCTPINVPDSGAPEDLDPVCAVSLRHTVQAVGTLPDMPVVIALQAFRFVGIAGADARELARAIVTQLAVAHGPETVSFAALGAGWEWLKWLPHCRQPDTARFRILIVDDVATTGVEDFIDDPSLTTIIDVGSRRSTALGVRSEQEGLALIADGGLHVVTASGEEELGTPDLVSARHALVLARRLAECTRPDSSVGAPQLGTGGGELPALLGHRDIDGIGGPGMWPGREGSARLKVPIGLDDTGRPVHLDLKESAQGGMGPHGLCIGATGSGKSELLRTLVAALAATHSPEELNLVLVDFKGGATFLGCDSLPHTSAVITNLEEESTLVTRMYDAISGEMNRRQEVLRAAGNFANVTEYTAARAQGREDLEPLPALVIVLDEFSELLAQHPDFADLFVAVGRLGRSLHVHLLLASQRLEEGRLRGLDSHLSYRLGLKTFSASESRQVLGVPDAYHLPAEPGAGYLKTDADALTRFRAAYVSGAVRRVVAGTHHVTSGVSVFSGWEDPNQKQQTLVEDSTTTVLASVVDAAREEATRLSMSAHRLWLPPLPAVVELPTVAGPLLERSGSEPVLDVPVGLIDRPYHQRQDPLIVDFGSKGGHAAVCGGPQSGKSMAVRTMVTSLAAVNSPDLIRFYVIDLGGGQLSTLERLPHVAGVAGRHEPEKIRRIVDEVMTWVHEPARRHTFLVIDGWHHVGTSGADFEDLAEAVTEIAADGPSARVHVVVSTARWTSMRPSIRDLISHRLELRLGEPLDSLVDRKAQAQLPDAPGRGLTFSGEPMLVAASSNQDLAHISTLFPDSEPVPALKMLPDSVALETIAPVDGAITWGVGGPYLAPVGWNVETSPHLVAVGGQGSGKSTLLATLMAGISHLPRLKARMVVIDHRRAHLGSLDEDMLAAYSATSASTEQALRDTATTLRARLPGTDVTPAQLAARDWWEGPDIFVVIDDVDLVAESALSALVELIPHARDIGMHLVVARKSGGFGRAMFQPFFSALRDVQPDAVLFDADKEEGAIFGMKPSHQPPGRALVSVHGEVFGLCHVAQATKGESDDE